MRMVPPHGHNMVPPPGVGDENIDPQLRTGNNGMGTSQPQLAPHPYSYPAYPGHPYPLPPPPVFYPHPGPPLQQQPVRDQAATELAAGHHGAENASPPPSPTSPPSQPAPVLDLTRLTPPPTQPSTSRPQTSKRGRSDTTSAGGAAAPKKAKGTPDPAADQAAALGTEALGLHWSVGDRDLLYHFFLGTNNDKNFETLKKNRNHLFEKASKELFNSRHSANAVRGQWDRSLKTYQNINVFDEFTGGGGDGDLAVLKTEIEAARQAGKEVGGLTAKVYKEWDQKQWLYLFDTRLQSNPKVRRQKSRHSNMPLSSDNEQDAPGDGEDSAGNGETVDGASARGSVSEPKYSPLTSPAKKARGEAAQSIGSIGSYLKDKVASDREVHAQMVEVRKAKLELDRRAADRADAELRMRQEQQQKQANASLAKDVLKADGASQELRQAAEDYLMKMFKSET